MGRSQRAEWVRSLRRLSVVLLSKNRCPGRMPAAWDSGINMCFFFVHSKCHGLHEDPTFSVRTHLQSNYERRRRLIQVPQPTSGLHHFDSSRNAELIYFLSSSTFPASATDAHARIISCFHMRQKHSAASGSSCERRPLCHYGPAWCHSANSVPWGDPLCTSDSFSGAPPFFWASLSFFVREGVQNYLFLSPPYFLRMPYLLLTLFPSLFRPQWRAEYIFIYYISVSIRMFSLSLIPLEFNRTNLERQNANERQLLRKILTRFFIDS